MSLMQIVDVLVGALAGSGVTLLVTWVIDRRKVASLELPDIDG